MEIPHFINGKSCLYHDYHGYSCAVNALLEFFYFGICKYIPKCQFDSSSELNRILYETCVIRDKVGMASCAMKEPVWHWLCNNLVSSYALNGRYDAEIMSCLQEMANSSTSFGFQFKSSIHCCHSLPTKCSRLPSLTLSHTCIGRANGELPLAVELQVNSFLLCNSACQFCHKRVPRKKVKLKYPIFI